MGYPSGLRTLCLTNRASSGHNFTERKCRYKESAKENTMESGFYLFDMDQYEVAARHSRRHSMPLSLRQALRRLRRTLEAVPPQEMEQRRKRWKRVCQIRGRR